MAASPGAPCGLTSLCPEREPRATVRGRSAPLAHARAVRAARAKGSEGISTEGVFTSKPRWVSNGKAQARSFRRQKRDPRNCGFSKTTLFTNCEQGVEESESVRSRGWCLHEDHQESFVRVYLAHERVPTPRPISLKLSYSVVFVAWSLSLASVVVL